MGHTSLGRHSDFHTDSSSPLPSYLRLGLSFPSIICLFLLYHHVPSSIGKPFSITTCIIPTTLEKLHCFQSLPRTPAHSLLNGHSCSNLPEYFVLHLILFILMLPDHAVSLLTKTWALKSRMSSLIPPISGTYGKMVGMFWRKEGKKKGFWSNDL